MTRLVDTVIRNALIVDGTGREPIEGDVVIGGSRMKAICDGGDVRGRDEIDASGLAAAPGFIDVHTHDDFAALVYPDMGFKLSGGEPRLCHRQVGSLPHPMSATGARDVRCDVVRVNDPREPEACMTSPFDPVRSCTGGVGGGSGFAVVGGNLAAGAGRRPSARSRYRRA